MIELDFDVPGDPVPQGSTRAFARNGKAFTSNDPTGKIERWRGDVRTAARPVLDPESFALLTGPVGLTVEFRIQRPASHYLPANGRRPVRVLRDDAPRFHAQEPDADKLARAVLDALTHVVYVDDRQVARLRATKVWADVPGAHVRITELEEER